MTTDTRKSDRDLELSSSGATPGTVVVWHDYRDTYWVNRINRAPEVLAEWGKLLPIKALKGSRLAFCVVPEGRHTA